MFLYGMPGDTKENMNRLVRFALDLKVDYANFEAIYFMPSFPLYEKMIKSGIFPREAIEEICPLRLRKILLASGIYL